MEISDKEELDKLAHRIKQLREQIGYKSYETFAYEKGLPRAQYGRYEKGENMKYLNLLKVIRALGVSPADFFAEFK